MSNGVGNSVVRGQIMHDPERAATTLKYEADTITVGASETDYDIKAASSKLWNKINVTREMTLRVTEGNIALKMNSINEDPIDLLMNEVFEIEGYPISNLFVSTGDASATIRVIMIGWN